MTEVKLIINDELFNELKELRLVENEDLNLLIKLGLKNFKEDVQFSNFQNEISSKIIIDKKLFLEELKAIFDKS